MIRLKKLKNKRQQPLQNYWDTFWRKEKEGRFTRLSWSKIRIMSILDRYIKPGATVLDAGCGSGFFSAYFISKGCTTYSLDYSPESLILTREKTQNRSKEYLLKDLLKEEMGTGYDDMFDLVFSDGLFEHFSFSEQDTVFRNIKKMKKENGIIATFVPNKYSLWNFIRPLYMPHIKEKPFSISELENLYKRNNCNIIEAGGVNVLPLKYSPEPILSRYLGMLLFCIGK